MLRRLMVIGLLGVSALLFALTFETSTAEARHCRGRRFSRSRVYYAPSTYYRPRVSIGVGFYGGFGPGFYGGHGHGFHGGHGHIGHGHVGHGH